MPEPVIVLVHVALVEVFLIMNVFVCEVGAEPEGAETLCTILIDPVGVGIAVYVVVIVAVFVAPAVTDTD